MRFYPAPRTRDEASAWIDRNLSLYEELGFGFWLVESNSDAEFLGYCGIRPQEELDEIEFGWHIRKRYWSRGIATEAALGCRDLAFERFGIKRLVAVIDPKNTASIRVAERIGMTSEGIKVVDDFPCLIYAIEVA